MKPTGRRILFRVVFIVFCLVAIPIVWFLVRRVRLANDVNRRLADIRAAGLPTNGEELNKWYPVAPDDQNAALVVTQAVGLLRDFDSTNSRYWELNDFKIPPRGQRLSVKQRSLLSDYVAMNAPALAKAHEAARLPKSRYPLDLRQGFELLLPHLRLKTLAKIEEYTALLALGTSRSNQATASIANILNLARTLEAEQLILHR